MEKITIFLEFFIVSKNFHYQIKENYHQRKRIERWSLFDVRNYYYHHPAQMFIRRTESPANFIYK